jgi:murein DD-endopeptidase MepM/ murein hydrolase activator NlpD
MSNQEIKSPRSESEQSGVSTTDHNDNQGLSPAEKFWNQLLRVGLGESALRVGTAVFSLLLVLAVVWMVSRFYLNRQEEPPAAGGAITPTSQAAIPLPAVEALEPAQYSSFGISRQVQTHTDRPAQPRTEMTTYVIEKGDTLFGIAEKYGLKPQTLLWSNTYTLGNDPHNIYPGVTLEIPPVDGAIYMWNEGDGLNGVSKFYNVTPDAIINWPGNNLKLEALGDLSLPNIAAGTMLFVPGGEGSFSDWLPQYTREKPAESSISGSACGVITSGYIGYGTFVWPTTETWLSGYDYSPETNHRAIDIAGDIGNPVFATDAGVVVYSNWNTQGYGNLIVVDHGNGWQSVYAHLDNYAKYCGDNVEQGEIIGTLGTTGNSSGPHLHFELRNEQYGAVNPWDFLQIP